MNETIEITIVKYHKLKMINNVLMLLLIVLSVIDNFIDTNTTFFVVDLIVLIIMLMIFTKDISKWIITYREHKTDGIEYAKEDIIQYIFVVLLPIQLGVRVAMLIY